MDTIKSSYVGFLMIFIACFIPILAMVGMFLEKDSFSRLLKESDRPFTLACIRTPTDKTICDLAAKEIETINKGK